jgi:hypothetical protein
MYDGPKERGTRTGSLHCVPFVDVEKTMSFASPELRKRPSCHATYRVPAASAVALGSDGALTSARSSAGSSDEMRTGWEKVAPPSCETTAATRSSWATPRPPWFNGAKKEYGTTRSPFGRVTGIGPENTAPGPVTPGWSRCGFDHVWPPSSLERMPSCQWIVST